MKKCNCPKCNKELIRLEPYETGIYSFYCDNCDLDITLDDKKEKEFEIIKESEDIAYMKRRYPKIMELLSRDYILDRYFKINKYEKYSENNCHIGYGKQYPILFETDPSQYLDIDENTYINPKITFLCNEEIKIMIYGDCVELAINRVYYYRDNKLENDSNENYIFHIDIRTDIDYIIWNIIKNSLGANEAERFMDEIGKEFKNEEDELS